MAVFSFKTKILRQYESGPWLGGLKDLAGRTLFYVSIINFILISVTAYNTTLRVPIIAVFPWFTFLLFIGCIIILVMCGMVLEYKFIVPSSVTYANIQSYMHNSLIRRDLSIILEKLEKLEKLEGQQATED